MSAHASHTRHTFAPGLLAIQERPPGRAPRAVLHHVATLFTLLVLWAALARLDIIASAPGRLVPQTHVKIVQPAEAGTVQAILVQEGQTVEAGQALIRMDATLQQADARVLDGEFQRKRLQLRRIEAELADRPLLTEPGDDPLLLLPLLAQHRAREQTHQDALAQERAVLKKARHDAQASEALLHKLSETVPSYRRSAAAFERLAQAGFYSAVAAEEKQRERFEKERDLQAQAAALDSARATIAASETRLDQIASARRSELHNERLEVQAQLQRLQEEREKTAHKVRQLVLHAPQRGVIKDLATHTPGAVVPPGAVLMSLVPHEEPLRAEVLVRNEDVGFVHEGQRVRIKLSAYPFQKHGMIDGRVSAVGPDATPAADPAATAHPYKVLVDLQQPFVQTDGHVLRLTPGMQLLAEIHQGERSVMAYLLSPVHKAWHESGRER